MSAVSDSVPGSPAMVPSSTSLSSSTSSPSFSLSHRASSTSSSSRILFHPASLGILLILCATLASSISLAAASPPSALVTPRLPLGTALPHQAPAFISKNDPTSPPLVDPLSVVPGSQLQKRQAGPVVYTSDLKPAPTTTKPSKTKPTTMATSVASAAATSSVSTQATPVPDSKGDTALFGKPSVIGGYNLTSGILIYGAFLILFLVSVGAATWQRAKYRDQFRKQQNKMEGGKIAPADGGKSRRGGGNTSEAELSDAALFKQASISKRALMKDVGPGGVLAANEAMKTKIAAANGAGRSFEDRQQQQSSVRFGDSNATSAPGGRSGGMKKNSAPNGRGAGQDGYEMNSYGQIEDPLSYYQDNQDTTDYSRPPLTESHDPYYSSGSSHSGYLDQVEDYHNPSSGGNSHLPKATSQGQPKYQPQVFVQRTNSSRMPQTDLHDGNNILRSNSGQRNAAGAPTRSGSGGASRSNAPVAPVPGRITTQGLLDRSGSGGSSRTNSPIDGGMSRNISNASSGRTRVSPSPTLMHPTPIARSNSTRLPASMRGGGAGMSSVQQGPSGLSQQTNNYDYNYM